MTRRGHEVRRAAQHGAASDALGDRLLGDAVAAQVGHPPVAHRVEEPDLDGGRLDQHEPPRGRVVRCRGGDGGGYGTAYGGRIDGFVGELAYGAPSQHRLA